MNITDNITIQPREVVIDGDKTTYYKMGKGKPVLFLHGGRVSAQTFRKFLTLLAKDYTVIAPDIPGHGRSFTPSKTWSFTEYSEFFERFLAALKIENALIIGYSMGGGIALHLASQSSRVSKLVLINSSGLRNPHGNRFYHDCKRILFYITHPQYASAFYQLAKDCFLHIWKHKSNLAQIGNIRKKYLTTPQNKAFPIIQIPTLIIWSKNDSIYPISTAYEFLHKLPGSSLIIVKGTHDWLLYNPLPGVEKIRE